MAIKKDSLWSMSTTIREAERILGFLRVAALLDGEKWDSENQQKFQILLIQNHQYLSDTDNTQVRNKLNETQIKALKEWDKKMSYKMAESIFKSKQYLDPAMRGRQSMSPLVKLGLIFYDNKIVRISDKGKKLLDGVITFEEMILDSLLKYQYPNPTDKGFQGWNTKPFINALRLIKRVNEKCEKKGWKIKGISSKEFGIFVLSLKRYNDIDHVTDLLLDFRQKRDKLKTLREKDIFTDDYCRKYLIDFNNPVKNCKEYTDNMIRYFRMTKYIYLRGKYDNTFIDLEPRRITEINSILENDNGECEKFTLEEWNQYMGSYGGYFLPFESMETLSLIASEILTEISSMESILHIPVKHYDIPKEIGELKRLIKELREYRTYLQNLIIKQTVHRDLNKIDETIESLSDIHRHNTNKLAKRLSIELEKWANVALNILNDAKYIKPNSPVGDDNEPTYTAPNGVPDIECFYENFNAICEVTMLTGRDQWYNEGQPVMRHLRAFENKHSILPSYCLFIAPSLHKDTINTFYIAVKYEYEGIRQKIIPITITQLKNILLTIKRILETKRSFSHQDIQKLYEVCTDMTNIGNSTQWIEKINMEIENWSKEITA